MKTCQSLCAYDSFALGHAKVDDLDKNEHAEHNANKNNLEFADQYRKLSGKDWLQSVCPGKRFQHKK